MLAMATLFAAAPLLAQTADFAGPSNSSNADSASIPGSAESYTQPAAPIERSFADGQQHAPSPENYRPPQNNTSQPAQGIWLVTAPNASVQTVSATAGQTELRVERGLANVNVHHPADHSEITIDLPGGAVSLVKDGLYTFNAESNTVRVLHGEAVIASEGDKDIKVKEDHEFTFGAEARAQEAEPNQLRADLLQGNYGDSGYRHGDGYGYGPGYGFYGSPYAYGWPYYGFYGPGWGSPYYAYGPWGYPYGYGFGPGIGVGVGFGYYGGFRGGYGYRGGIGAIRGGLRR